MSQYLKSFSRQSFGVRRLDGQTSSWSCQLHKMEILSFSCSLSERSNFIFPPSWGPCYAITCLCFALSTNSEETFPWRPPTSSADLIPPRHCLLARLVGVGWSPSAGLRGRTVIFCLGFISWLKELNGDPGIRALPPKESAALQDVDLHIDLEEGSAYCLIYYISP